MSTLYNVEDVADKLQVARNTVTTWLQHGKLKGFRVGRRYKVPRTELAEFVGGEDRLQSLEQDAYDRELLMLRPLVKGGVDSVFSDDEKARKVPPLALSGTIEADPEGVGTDELSSRLVPPVKPQHVSGEDGEADPPDPIGIGGPGESVNAE